MKSVNALMARQELSHQQVMSYLVAGGDHYKSHSFVSLSWDCLDSMFHSSVTNPNKVNVCNSLTETITVQPDAVVSHDIIFDFQYRPIEEPFRSMCIWSYVELAEKITLSRDHRRMATVDEHHRSRCGVTSDAARRGRPCMPRGQFANGHPQCNTHAVRLRTVPHVVVFQGRPVP